MIPMLLKIKIPRKNKQPVNLYLPLFIAWLILLPILILFLPFYLVMLMICMSKGFGRLALLFFPMFFSILWNLRGLKVDVKDEGHVIYLSFI